MVRLSNKKRAKRSDYRYWKRDNALRQSCCKNNNFHFWKHEPEKASWFTFLNFTNGLQTTGCDGKRINNLSEGKCVWTLNLVLWKTSPGDTLHVYTQRKNAIWTMVGLNYLTVFWYQDSGQVGSFWNWLLHFTVPSGSRMTRFSIYICDAPITKLPVWTYYPVTNKLIKDWLVPIASSIWVGFAMPPRINWPITTHKLVIEHPCSAAAGLCYNTKTLWVNSL